jgi:hypothetical protein
MTLAAACANYYTRTRVIQSTLYTWRIHALYQTYTCRMVGLEVQKVSIPVTIGYPTITGGPEAAEAQVEILALVV